MIWELSQDYNGELVAAVHAGWSSFLDPAPMPVVLVDAPTPVISSTFATITATTAGITTTATTTANATPSIITTSIAAMITIHNVTKTTSATSNTNILVSGSGDGTYYYDITGKTCDHGAPFQENNGYTFCEPDSGFQTLVERDNNYIVALAVDEMNANKANLCGKKVIVTYAGNVVPGEFVVWDACVACTGGVRLDFSLSALLEIEPDTCQLGVIPGIKWEVTDTQVIPFVE
ncbi:hypothetical protein HK100_009471 [Physocladia obscura]|uniref:Uncharacterized protein n=1 Tax=Physocladia obscura TaxID=109957 RepID=A0AAD5X9Q1_9FUNG|nr:hypothetical protein HK100_009471 [Physocladia obscura]